MKIDLIFKFLKSSMRIFHLLQGLFKAESAVNFEFGERDVYQSRRSVALCDYIDDIGDVCRWCIMNELVDVVETFCFIG